MKKRQKYFLMCIGIASLMLFGGCKENGSTEPVVTDEGAMSEIIANDAFFNFDNLGLNDGDPSPAGQGSLHKTEAGIIPYSWGRRITSANRSVEFTVITDSTASAVVTHTWRGVLWIYGKYSLQDTALTLISKQVTESVSRNVKFIRKDHSSDPRHNWKITEISAVAGGTTGNTDIRIQRVEFFIGSDSIEISDPLNTYFKVERRDGPGRIHCVSPGILESFKIRITITSADPDSDFVAAYRPIWILNEGVYRHAFMTLVSSLGNRDNSYTRVYEHTWRGAWAGRHHILIGAVTRRSLFDDQAACASQMWGIPYLVE